MKVFRQPRHDGPYHDRSLECQEALEDYVGTIVDYAEAAGWTREETLSAIIAIAGTMQHCKTAADDTEIALTDLIRRRPNA